VAQSKTADNSPSGSSVTGAQRDLAGLHLDDSGEIDEDEKEREKERYKERVGLSMKQEELVAKVKKDEEESGKSNISLIVVGELDVWLSVLTELMKDRTC
jgi:elongation factor 1 alpha-like protein